ncbi:filamentous haemagglutinin family protein [Prosthecobacter vanneervenii]|uniref:Filamentous hemagglutinin family protein n=1 Tax=Prosthecobacter vanneervenii TaxID=48466 RepID=A0A7W7YCP5_9BACT|nr:filamentous haemagglutinin family protein [Prosthecobacter vanneervenii]MBB5033763.1 filamentous hemagglutinin family protein [Prosthecobacter vanneervenii]
MNLSNHLRLHRKRHAAVHAAAVFCLSLLVALHPVAVHADVLRPGGVGGPAAVTTPGVDPVATAQVVNQGRANASDILVRAADAAHNVQLMQDAARALAVSGPNHLATGLPDVPNGLTAGGLVVDPGVSAGTATWSGAALPTQTSSAGHTTVTVQQNAAQALLSWQTFNVGKDTTLAFDQSAGGPDVGKWIAFNMINDPTGNPTQILGSIQAAGQVYVINQNGIIFGGSSQVDVHTLVASSLPINTNLISRGLLNNPDAQFLFSALALPAGTSGPTNGFTPPAAPAGGKIGDVTVQAGAQIEAPTTDASVGGRVVLVGPNVTNNGTISTPDGQTILAAGLQVGFVAHSSSDPSLRGLDVYVGAVVDPASLIPPYAGTATNTGEIEAPRGDVTMTGKTVVQAGAIDSTTSVSLNGRIDLLASYNAITNTKYDSVLYPNIPPFLLQSTGQVEVAAGSVTQILPEWSSTETVTGTELALRSQINMQGLTVHLGAGAIVLAPNAVVNLNAGVWQAAATSPPQSLFVLSGGQIYLDASAVINVAGSTDVNVPVTQNLITLQLRAAELADSPLQRDGVLRGQTITVDIRETGTYNGKTWVGTPLANISGYASLIQRTVGELTTAGGTVNLNAGGSVVVQNGAQINTSAGWINYTGGTVQTTKVITGGTIIDISQATPDLVYSGIYSPSTTQTDLTWNVATTFYHSTSPAASYYDPGLLHSGDGGQLSITAPGMALDGSFLGSTFYGLDQLVSGPALGKFSVNFQAQQLINNQLTPYSPTPPTVTFQSGTAPTPVAAFSVDASGNPLAALSAGRLAAVSLAPELLTTSGFGSLSVVNAEGRIVVPSSVALTAGLHGTLSLTGANLDIFGQLSAPGGSITLMALEISPQQLAAVESAGDLSVITPYTGRGLLTLGSTALVTTAGTLTDDRLSAGALQQAHVLGGGTVTLKAYSASLAAGSILDVSGGIYMNAAGTAKFGNAGTLTIQAGHDPQLPYFLGGQFTQFSATLLGYSGAVGGTLSVSAPLVQVGGTALSANSLVLQPSFFQQGGFTSYKISGTGESTGVSGQFLPGVYVASGTTIQPVADNLAVAAGTTLATTLVRKPVGLRSPMSIEFDAPGSAGAPAGPGVFGQAVRGGIVLDTGAVITTDPQAHVTLKGQTAAVLGTIIAPGGNITISGGDDSTALLFADGQTQGLTTVFIGPQSVLSAAGTRLLVPDPYGLRLLGQVLAGGDIKVSGNIVAAAGALLDVSGTTDVLDLTPAQTDPTVTSQPTPGSGVTSPVSSLYAVRTQVDSSGGSITLQGGQMLFTDATLRGNAGGPTALGGTLSLSSGRFYTAGTIPPVLDTTLQVKQSGLNIPVPLPANATAIGRTLLSTGGTPLISRGYFSANAFAQSGMDSLVLGGKVQFSGATSINARGSITLADGGVLFADAAVSLSAAAVSVGLAFAPPVRPEDLAGQLPFSGVASTSGSGSLSVSAGHVEVGTLTLQNISSASLAAVNGDLVGDGILAVSGALTLTAGQIYAPTATQFTAVAYGAGGSITTQLSGGLRQLPLSAGSTLSLYAATINQLGVLRAPFGTINLGWDGTGTAPTELLTGTTLAFPVTTQLTLGAGSITSVSAVDPLTGAGIVIPYGASFDGTSWIDPRGVDITAGGLPVKTINIKAGSISMNNSASVDLRGGGDLMAYRWTEGNGGTTDILDTDGSYAVIPGYQSDTAPYGAYNPNNVATNLIYSGGSGYVNGTLHAGDRIYLAGSSTLAAGYYTLLPARYALLPGAVLVTPVTSSLPTGTQELPGGASYVSGYQFNDLNSTRTVPTLTSSFEVIGQSVIHQRSDYTLLYASSFLKTSTGTTQLPQDSGYLLFQASQSMSLLGQVASASLGGAGRGANIDIAAPLNFSITNAASSSTPGTISLNAAALSAFGAESLIIGGKRTVSSSGTTLTVMSTGITVDNAGSALSAKDLTLATTGVITLAANAQIISTGALASTAANFSVSGNGSLIRVAQSTAATLTRSGATSGSGPAINIGANARVQGTSATLDTTGTATLDPTAVVSASAYAINSGRISIQLGNPGTLQSSPGLVISSAFLSSLQNASAISLLSYSSIDVYGTGTLGSAGLASLTLSTGEIRGFNQAGGTAQFMAQTLLLNNQAGVSTIPGSVTAATGMLTLNAGILRLGMNQVALDQFSTVNFLGAAGVIGEGAGGVAVQGVLNVQTPLLTAAAGAARTLAASGNLALISSAGPVGVTPGLGATLGMAGSGVTLSAPVSLPSGVLSVRATSGNVSVGALLDVSGMAQTFFDKTKYSDGGSVLLTADAGSVDITAQGGLSVAASSGGGNAGSLTVSVVNGTFSSSGTLQAQGGAGGSSGSFSLDTSALPTTSALAAALSSASFTLSQTIRVRTGSVTVDGVVKASTYNLAVDQGSITVTGTINAAGTTGGSIDLAANGSVTLSSGSLLTVAGQNFNNAGKGGDITLESGTQRNGVAGTGSVDIRTGSTLDLSVAAKVAGAQTVVGSSAYQGQFSGRLHIRAPQNSTFNDVLVNPINGTIIDASSILVEGYRLYSFNQANAIIRAGSTAIASEAITTTTLQTNANTFLGAAGSTSANYTAMTNRLLANNSSLSSVFVLAPGVEIVNRGGDISLGTAATTTAADWDLSGFRFGAKSAPGVLTLRASGNINFFNALSDGFTPTLASTRTQSDWLWLAPLSAQNTALPVNTQSWSYRITAGADVLAADFRQALPLASLGSSAGSVIIGKNGGLMITTTGINGVTSAVISATSGTGRGLYQVVRTGSGDIDVNAGRSIQLANQFATIYTAGAQVADPTLGGTFDVSTFSQAGGTTQLGAAQQGYGMYFGVAGGNVTLAAGQNIERTGSSSSRELPNNWLYRRGYVNPTTGAFDLSSFGSAITSTSWWVDYSNFFEGVGALGGGNVSLRAGNNITNVDAVAPTNARMSKGTTANPLAVNQTLLELGGGDLKVYAGNNIDAGVYYVERGQGTLFAGGQITTNATRSTGSINITTGVNAVQDSNTWLPTTLFVGRGGFDVSARGSVLLGPVANAMLLPQGVNNTYRLKSYFSTYAASSYVNVSSLGGSVTLREGATVNNTFQPLLLLWASSQQLRTNSSSSNYQPWLRLAETQVTPFATALALMAPTLRATSYSGGINIAGNITLSPSPTGTLELLARTSINGLQPNGLYSPVTGTFYTAWGAASINVSDANPQSLPGVNTPFAYQAVVGTVTAQAATTRSSFLSSIDQLFSETGATSGTTVEARQTLHKAGLLHAGDSQPIRLYAAGGDISGLMLFSPKVSQIYAARDITDVSLYLQNTSTQDTSIVAAGRDISAYNASSALRLLAAQTGNIVVSTASALGAVPLAGDIQIGGGGTLEVLAGRNLDLGSGATNSNGTGAGITSIGNTRNPYLPYAGASIIAGAGVGAATSLTGSGMDFSAFISGFVLSPAGAKYLAEVSPTPGAPLTATSFSLLPAETQKKLALAIFYRVLRDTGRDYNDPDSAGYRSYAQGFAAIAALFPSTTWSGSINTQSRDIRTLNGGDISLLAPGGGLQLASSVIGSPLTPPGIITDSGGSVSVFAKDSVNLGISRIFTLKGGDITIWSSTGDIAAGASSKTVQAAPPTRVIVDPQSANVATDLAGLATGGGIGVLASVKGVPPGSVDLIAPVGVVDAGDAGIRATGNLNIAAVQVLNSSNIVAGGTTSGTPVASVSAPNMGAVSSAASAGAATANASMAQSAAQTQQPLPRQELPSIITVEVLGYGGGDDDDDERKNTGAE